MGRELREGSVCRRSRHPPLSVTTERGGLRPDGKLTTDFARRGGTVERNSYSRFMERRASSAGLNFQVRAASTVHSTKGMSRASEKSGRTEVVCPSLSYSSPRVELLDGAVGARFVPASD